MPAAGRGLAGRGNIPYQTDPHSGLFGARTGGLWCKHTHESQKRLPAALLNRTRVLLVPSAKAKTPGEHMVKQAEEEEEEGGGRPRGTCRRRQKERLGSCEIWKDNV